MHRFDGSQHFEASSQMHGSGGEGEVAHVDGGGSGEGANLRFGRIVVRAIPVEFLLGRVGV